MTVRRFITLFLLALAALALPAAPALARGGGGCVRRGTLIETPAGPRAVESLRPGDAVFAVVRSQLTAARVQASFEVQPREYIQITAGPAVLRVTAEHPVATAPGEFTIAANLKPGQRILTRSPAGLVETVIERIDRLPADAPAFNLLVTPGGTYIATGVVVHNKGCFLPDTPITLPGGSQVRIADIEPGQRVLAFEPDGRIVETTVRRIITHDVDEHWLITAGGIELAVTAEHPFYIGAGRFQTLESLRLGAAVYVYDGQKLAPQPITSMRRVPGNIRVYNLQTDDPHTFLAHGVAVHNKGGGGGGGGGFGGFGGGFSGYRSSGYTGPSTRGYTGDNLGTLTNIFLACVAGVVILIVMVNAYKAATFEDLDYSFTRAQIERKSAKTGKLLAFLAKQDQLMDATAMRQRSIDLFTEFQHCWTARNIVPLKNEFMPDLLTQLAGQIVGMINTNEINVMESLDVVNVDIVNTRYMHKADQREFTALITARARDYYIDALTRDFLRGDESVAKFQEFWTFQQQNGKWLLREIEQTRESDALKDENFVEMFTDAQLKAVYGGDDPAAGPAGPWLSKGVETKASRTERALNFLSQTDRLWNRPLMLERARAVFLRVCLARQARDTQAVLDDDLFPDVAANLRGSIEKMRSGGGSIELRNLCVRKVELILFRNYAGKDRDEYVVRISAHAQQIIRRGSSTVREDDDVKPFVEFWSFVRLDNQWKLKEVLPDATGKSLVGLENIDEDSSAAQLQWYYSKNRA